MSQQLHIDDIPKPKLSKRTLALLDLFQRGMRLSKQDILRELRIWNSGDAVLKLRKAGYPIKMERVREGDTEYGIYFLEAVDTKAA